MDRIVNEVIRINNEVKNKESAKPEEDPFIKEFNTYMEYYDSSPIDDNEDTSEVVEVSFSSKFARLPLLVRILIKIVFVCLPVAAALVVIHLYIPHEKYNLLKGREGLPINFCMETIRYGIYFISLYVSYHVIEWVITFCLRIFFLMFHIFDTKPNTRKRSKLLDLVSHLMAIKSYLITAIFSVVFLTITRILIVDNSSHYIHFIKKPDDDTNTSFNMMDYFDNPISSIMEGLSGLMGGAAKDADPDSATSTLDEIPEKLPNYNFIYYIRGFSMIFMVSSWLLFLEKLVIQYMTSTFHSNTLGTRTLELARKLQVERKILKIAVKQKGPVHPRMLEEGLKRPVGNPDPVMKITDAEAARRFLAVMESRQSQKVEPNSDFNADTRFQEKLADIVKKNIPNAENPGRKSITIDNTNKDALVALAKNMDLFAIGKTITQKYSPTMAIKTANEIYQFYSQAYTSNRVMAKLHGEVRDGIGIEDFKPYMDANLAEDAADLLIPSTSNTATLKDVIKSIKQLYKERINLCQGIEDRGQILQSLDSLFKVIIAILIFIIGSAHLGFGPAAYIATIASLGVVCILVMGELAKDIILSFIFVFLIHVYDVGDIMEVDGEKLQVLKIDLMTTTFKKITDGSVVYYPTTSLMTMPLINQTRANNEVEVITVSVPSSTPMQDVWKMRKDMEVFLGKLQDIFTGKLTFDDFSISDDTLSIVIAVQYVSNFHDYRQRRYSSQLLRSKLVSLLDQNTIECKSL